jgi:hypothetical protein
VLSFVAHLDEAFGKIFASPETVERCTHDLKRFLKEETGTSRVKIHWLWNRAIAIFLATVGSLSVLNAEQLMESALVIGLKKTFFRHPNGDQVTFLGTASADDKSATRECNQLYQALVVSSLFGAWLLALLAKVEVKATMKATLAVAARGGGGGGDRALTRRSLDRQQAVACTSACFVFVAEFALTFCTILATWMVFAVWIGTELTMSELAPN